MARHHGQKSSSKQQKQKEQKHMQLPQDGTHRAKKTPGQPVTLFESKEGVPMLQVPVTLINANVAWSGFGVVVLLGQDGQAHKKNIAALREIFPSFTAATLWGESAEDPNNVFNAAETDVNAEFEATGEAGEYMPKVSATNPNPQPQPRYNIKWINPVGGGSGFRPEPIDRNTALTKWGALLGASQGTAKAASKPVAAKSTAKPAASGPPSRRAVGSATIATPRTATMDEVWAALIKKHGIKEDDQEWAEANFFPAQDAVKPNANGELSPQEWGQVATNMGV